MKITYTGRQVELKPAQLKKLETQFSKTGKLLDGKRECETHVILSLERHLHNAEAKVTYYGQQLVGVGSDPDLFSAIHAAAEKLAKQAVKARTKWRDTKRAPRDEEPETAPEEIAVAKPAKAVKPPKPQVNRITDHETNKPMTVDEAILAMDKTRDYLVYRDAKTARISVLLRRRDGHFDLVEG